jgi:hypothetical protein
MTSAGGEGGIRTHDTVSRIHAFQACALSHSATSPLKSGRHYSGRDFGYNPRPCAAAARNIVMSSSRRLTAQILAAQPSTSPKHRRCFGYRPRRPGAPRNHCAPISLFRQTGRGEAGGRHGSWAIVMAPRHSDTDHHFDMGAWRPTRLILPSGSSVVSAYEGPTPSRAFSLRASTPMRVILH